MSPTPQYDPTARAAELFGDVPWRRYVALGDSTTEGLGEAYPGYPDVGWAQMVADALAPLREDFSFHNLGRRYLTTRRIRETQLEPAIDLRPDLVTVVAGGNDVLLRGFQPAVTEIELDAIVRAMRDAGATVLTCTMFDICSSGLLNEQMVEMLGKRFESLNEAVRRVADRYDLLLVDLARDPISLDHDIYSSDLQHANRRGHAATAELIVRSLASAQCF